MVSTAAGLSHGSSDRGDGLETVPAEVPAMSNISVATARQDQLDREVNTLLFLYYVQYIHHKHAAHASLNEFFGVRHIMPKHPPRIDPTR